jgi:catechol 2,3-dioxygenase-like lactoylglutathione lyase family enzyme
MFTYTCYGTNDLDRAACFYDAVMGMRDPDGNKLAAVCRGVTERQ